MINNEEAALIALNYYHKNGRTVVFDFDNTIYPEAIYLDQAYKKFSVKIEEIFHINGHSIHSYMMCRLYKDCRKTILQDTCAKFKLPIDNIREIFFFYLRQSKPNKKINLFNWAEIFFINTENLKNCAIITNGNIYQQKNKIQDVALLDRLPTKQIIYANEHKPKPAVDSARYLENLMNCKEPVYFGDSRSDFVFAKAAGWDFYKIDCDFVM